MEPTTKFTSLSSTRSTRDPSNPLHWYGHYLLAALASRGLPQQTIWTPRQISNIGRPFMELLAESVLAYWITLRDEGILWYLADKLDEELNIDAVDWAVGIWETVSTLPLDEELEFDTREEADV